MLKKMPQSILILIIFFNNNCFSKNWIYQGLTVVKLSTNNKNNPIAVSLEPGENLSSGKYHVHARIKIPQKQFMQTINKKELVFNNDAINYFSAVAKYPTGIEFSSLKPINLNDYDELWIDYFAPDSNFVLHAILDAYHDNSILHYFSEAPSVVHIIKPKMIPWFKRNLLYLIKRELGLQQDNNWYYLQHKKYTIVENLLHEKLENISWIDITFTEDTKIKGAHIRLSGPKFNRPNIMVKWEEIPKSINITGEGKTLRLYVGEINAIKKQLRKNKGQVFLSELALHLIGNADQIAINKPIKKVIFYNHKVMPNLPSKNFFNLNQNLVNLPEGRQRLIVDLHKVQKLQNDVWFLKGMLYMLPKQAYTFCDLNKLSLRFVATKRHHSPDILNPYIHNKQISQRELLKDIVKESKLSFDNVHFTNFPKLSKKSLDLLMQGKQIWLDFKEVELPEGQYTLHIATKTNNLKITGVLLEAIKVI